MSGSKWSQTRRKIPNFGLVKAEVGKKIESALGVKLIRELTGLAKQGYATPKRLSNRRMRENQRPPHAKRNRRDPNASPSKQKVRSTVVLNVLDMDLIDVPSVVRSRTV